MTKSQQTFLRDKELSEQWGAIVHSAWYEKVLVHARGAMMEACVTEEHARGAAAFEAILKGLCDVDSAPAKFPVPSIENPLDYFPRSRTAKT